MPSGHESLGVHARGNFGAPTGDSAQSSLEHPIMSSPRATRSSARKQEDTDNGPTTRAAKSRDRKTVKASKLGAASKKSTLATSKKSTTTSKKSTGAGEGDSGEEWSPTQQKQLDELLKRKAALQREQDDEWREDTRKRAAALAIEEQASDEEEDLQPSRKKAKMVPEPASGSDDDRNGESRSKGEGAGQGDQQEQEHDGDIAMEQVAPAPSRPKPRPAYKGVRTLTEGEQAITQKLDIVQTANRNRKKSEMTDSEHSDNGGDERVSQKKAAPGKNTSSVTVTQTNKTASSKGKARAARQDSSDDGDQLDATQSNSSEAENDDGERLSEDEDDVIEMPQTNTKKAHTSQRTNSNLRVRMKASDLPVDMKPLVNMAQYCLRNILGLRTTWTSDTTITSSHLVSNDVLVTDALKDARDSVDKDGKKMVTVRAAYRKLRNGREEEGNTQRKNVRDVLRNKMKRKAKVIVEHAYGLNVMQGHKRTQLVNWLLTTHIMKVRGGKRSIPNFVFGEMQVIWDNKNTISKKSHVKAEVPFRHPAIAKIIAQQWFVGHAKSTTPTEEFSEVPDNLIALVCNSIELGLREVAANTAVSFSNKLFAPKWDDLMSILEAMEQNVPDYYTATKRLLWEGIKGRAESGVGIDTVDSEDNNNMFINWLKLQTVALEDDRADQDDAEASGSGAKTKPAVQPKPSSGGTLKKTAGCTKPSSMSAAPATRSRRLVPQKAKLLAQLQSQKQMQLQTAMPLRSRPSMTEAHQQLKSTTSWTTLREEMPDGTAAIPSYSLLYQTRCVNMIYRSRIKS
ncbi:uncharacterized protein B0H18DRAFT_955239 [Fomitopsis serialis]|uniref:uncharacterized protein n=1 Tax=Fomitopsis serialis TaxID=139415 RepID=UPI0020085A7B|nr:uncharacterized protein B0H18DRAFT_955239 [Neoantrodia serialis]KAH9925190.1 hypothetical protein B0H18DRAFT_955239 [Neoantrodia serialis]